MTSKTILLGLLAAFVPSLGAFAQKKKAKETVTAAQLTAQYRFEEAATMLQSEIATAKRRRQPTDALEERLAENNRLSVMMDGTQQVIFVDSVVVDKARMLAALHLGSESGTITSYSRAFGKMDTTGCTAYQSQLGNKTIFAMPVKGKPMLHSCYIEGTGWSEPAPLVGLDKADTEQNYPFLMADGVTLYYGAVNEEGAGGYDIYFTRYDADDKSFRDPENAGMPFNSPANDYMLAIDEYNSLGYLVTDRHQPQGKVCIYTFIPPAVRVNLTDLGNMPDDKLRRLAALNSIAETQTDKNAVAQARQRMIAGMQLTSKAAENEFTFIVNDNTVYHSSGQFKNKQAKALAAKWKKASEELTDAEMQLEASRQLYSTAKPERKATLRQQILTMEQAYEKALEDYAMLTKEIRNLENNTK